MLAEDVEFHLGWNLFGAKPFKHQMSDLQWNYCCLLNSDSRIVLQCFLIEAVWDLKISAVPCLGEDPVIFHRIVRLCHKISFGLFSLNFFCWSYSRTSGYKKKIRKVCTELVHDQLIDIPPPHVFIGSNHIPFQPAFL